MDINELRELQRAPHVSTSLRFKFAEVADDIEHMQKLAAMDKKFILSQEAEIERLKAEGLRFAQWIDELYSSLPNDRPPGPPRMLLTQMRAAFGQSPSSAKEG